MICLTIEGKRKKNHIYSQNIDTLVTAWKLYKGILCNNFGILLFLHHIKTMMLSLTNSVLPIETRPKTFIADLFCAV